MTNPNRDEFLDNIRRALGRGPGASAPPDRDASTALFDDAQAVEARARSVKEEAGSSADELAARLQETAAEAGWKVARVASGQEAADYIAVLVRELEPRSILRSAHSVLDRLDLDAALSGTGIELGVMAIDEQAAGATRDDQRRTLRQRAIVADIGITGVDYAIAETGTCVLLPRKGLSRLVSLLPPVHVAVVEKGQVLPSLDELFTLRRNDFLQGDLGSYMNLITGPSRSADIEYTLVTGVHGPGEVHMVLIG